MSTGLDLPPELVRLYEIFNWRNAFAVLKHVHASEFEDVLAVLGGFQLRHSELAVGGGSKSAMAKSIDSALYARGWKEKSFDTQIVVDGKPTPSPTHKVDCFKGKAALEIEWNNKDPFFDRDLNNFRLLFDLQVIDVGVIVTRTTQLQSVLESAGRAKTTFGKATTHTEKLYPKIRGGGAGGCPVLVFGIKPEAYFNDR